MFPNSVEQTKHTKFCNIHIYVNIHMNVKDSK